MKKHFSDALQRGMSFRKRTKRHREYLQEQVTAWVFIISWNALSTLQFPSRTAFPGGSFIVLNPVWGLCNYTAHSCLDPKVDQYRVFSPLVTIETVVKDRNGRCLCMYLSFAVYQREQVLLEKFKPFEIWLNAVILKIFYSGQYLCAGEWEKGWSSLHFSFEGHLQHWCHQLVLTNHWPLLKIIF